MYKKILLIFSVLAILILPATQIATVHALPCMPGKYSHMNENGKFECKKIRSDDKTSADSSNVQIDSSNHKGIGDNIKNFFVGLAQGIGWFSIIVSFFVVIYAGYLYGTAGGKVAQMEDAKRHLIYAFIGMVFGTMTFVIMQLIGGVF